MAWYTASIIISCRLKKGKQKVFPVYENFTLLEASSPKEAFKKANQYAKKYVKIGDHLELNGKPAYWKFEGIRKMIELRDHFSEELDVERPENGVEVSYSYLEVNSKKKLKELASGESVKLRYVDAGDDE